MYDCDAFKLHVLIKMWMWYIFLNFIPPLSIYYIFIWVQMIYYLTDWKIQKNILFSPHLHLRHQNNLSNLSLNFIQRIVFFHQGYNKPLVLHKAHFLIILFLGVKPWASFLLQFLQFYKHCLHRSAFSKRNTFPSKKLKKMHCFADPISFFHKHNIKIDF